MYACSVGADTRAEEVEAHENRLYLLQVDILQALRVLKAFQRIRQQLLDKMCLKSLGQFDAFDEDILLKLSDNEIQYLKDACNAEHSRREELNIRNVEDKSGRPAEVRLFKIYIFVLFIYLFICLFVYLFFCLFVCLFICLFITYLLIYLFICSILFFLFIFVCVF